MLLNLNRTADSSRLLNSTYNVYGSMMSSLQRLASGLRINSAADGPADLVISERLRSQIATLNQEIENTDALIHKYSTADSQLSELRGHLNDLRDLAVGAANEGVNSPEAQAALDTAAQDILATYNDAVAQAEYNGTPLFDGQSGSVATVTALEGIDLSSPDEAVASLEAIDAALDELDRAQVEVGSTQANELESHLRTLQITSQNLQAAESTLRDTDFVLEYSRFLADSFRFRAGLAMMGQLNSTSEAVLGLLNSDR